MKKSNKASLAASKAKFKKLRRALKRAEENLDEPYSEYEREVMAKQQKWTPETLVSKLITRYGLKEAACIQDIYGWHLLSGTFHKSTRLIDYEAAMEFLRAELGIRPSVIPKRRNDSTLALFCEFQWLKSEEAAEPSF